MAKNTVDVVVKGDYTDKDIKRAISDLNKLQAASMSLGGKVQAMGSQVQAFGDKMSKAGKTLTASVTLPIVGVGAAATAMAVEFDSSMSKITALVGIAKDEVDTMRKSVLELSGQTAKSPKELADALFVVTSAGLRGEAALQALEFSAKAGAAGLGETADVARSLAGAMNAYGPEVVDAARATDMIVATARAGNFETSQFAGAIGRVLPFAKQAGASLEDMGGAVALLTRTNGDAAQSVTQVAALFRAFVVPTEEAKKALKGVGLSAADMRAAIAEDGLPAALTMLDEKLGGNREQLGRLLGSSEAASAAFQILDADAASLEGTFGAVNAAAGMTDEAFGVVADTTGFKLQQAFQNLKTSLIEFGDIIAPFVAQFAERLKALGDAFQNLSPQAKQFIVVGGAIAAAVGPVLLIVGKLVSMIGAAMVAIGGITAAGAILAIKVVAIVAAVAAVALAFKMMYDRSEALRNAVGTLITTVQNIARTLLGDVLGAFKGVTGEAGDLRSILDRVATVAGNILAGALQVLTGWWNVLANGVRAVIKVYEVVYTVLGMVANLIRGAVVAAIDILFNKLGPVSAAFRNLANGVKAAFSNIASVVTAAFNNAGAAVAAGINLAINAVNKMIDAYNKLADVLPGVSRATHIAQFEFKNMTSASQQAAYSANNLANDIGGYASQVLRGNQATEAGVSAFNNLGTAADGAIPGLDGLTNALAGAGGGGGGGAAKASDTATSKLDKFKEKFNEVAARLKSAREEIQAQYDGMAKSVTNAIMGGLDFGDAVPEMDEQGNRVGGTFIERLNEQANRAVEFANRIRTLIQQGLSPEAITMVVQEGINAGTKVADELINGGATAIDETNRLIESTQNAATEVGVFAADTYYGTGLQLAKDTEAGFVARFGPGGPGFNKLNNMMSHLAKSMERTTVITVVTRHVTEGIPGRRMGGPVAAGSPYIVGEAGPELFVPTMPGRIIPNHDMRASMTGVGGGGVAIGAGGTTINLVVNAGLGTDGPEVGRQIVDAIAAYSRRNGPVYASA